MEAALTIIYLLIVVLLFELCVITDEYYEDNYSPIVGNARARHTLMLVFSVFVLPAAIRLVMFWWKEFSYLGGDT